MTEIYINTSGIEDAKTAERIRNVLEKRDRKREKSVKPARGTPHEMIRQQWLRARPELRHRGFATLISHLSQGETWQQIIPDMYGMYPDDRLVVAYEIEVTSPVTEDKFIKYCNLWWLLDDEEWDLTLIIISRFGTISAQIDLQKLALERCLPMPNRGQRTVTEEAPAPQGRMMCSLTHSLESVAS